MSAERRIMLVESSGCAVSLSFPGPRPNLSIQRLLRSRDTRPLEAVAMFPGVRTRTWLLLVLKNFQVIFTIFGECLCLDRLLVESTYTKFPLHIFFLDKFVSWHYHSIINRYINMISWQACHMLAKSSSKKENWLQRSFGRCCFLWKLWNISLTHLYPVCINHGAGSWVGLAGLAIMKSSAVEPYRVFTWIMEASTGTEAMKASAVHIGYRVLNIISAVFLSNHTLIM